MRVRALSLLITACAGLAQEAPATFKSTTKLVEVSVIAQDQQGKPVADLRREDFQIFDNGAPQEIRLFLAETPARPAPEMRAPNTFTNQLAAGATVSGGSGRGGYSVILFDNLVTGFGDPITGEEGTGFGAQMIRRVLGTIPSDEKVALYALGRKLQIVREFTTDRESLERQLRAWKPSIDTADISLGILGKDEANASDRIVEGAARADMLQRLPSLDEQLKQIADHLAGIPGRKNLIWMANRFPIAGGAAIQKLMNAGVAIYPVDENGVMAPSRDQAQMRALAAQTGGVAYSLRNDIDVAVREAVEDGRVSYTLGFYQPGDDRKAAMHQLAVRVSRPGVTLRYRTSYVTQPPQPAPASPVADLVQAMNRPMDATVIGISASAKRESDQLDLSAAIDISGLDLELSQGVWKGEAEVVARFTTTEGVKAGDVISDTITFHLQAATYASMLRSGIPYRKQFKIPAKAVELKVVMGNLATGKIGTLTILLSDIK